METACLPAVGMVAMTGGDSAGNAGAQWTLSASTEGAQPAPESGFQGKLSFLWKKGRWHGCSRDLPGALGTFLPNAADLSSS